MTIMDAGAPMPQYQSHKKVWALQIDHVDGDTIHFVQGGRFAPRQAKNGMFARCTPVRGDYFVVYDDGYESISPQKAFEEGYTLIGG
jgi:hypothetical protein